MTDVKDEERSGPVDVLYGVDGRFGLGLAGKIYSFDKESFMGLAEGMLECVQKHSGDDKSPAVSELN